MLERDYPASAVPDRHKAISGITPVFLLLE